MKSLLGAVLLVGALASSYAGAHASVRSFQASDITDDASLFEKVRPIELSANQTWDLNGDMAKLNALEKSGRYQERMARPLARISKMHYKLR